MLAPEMNGHGHDFGHEFGHGQKIFWDFGHGHGQSHDIGHGRGFGHAHVRKPRTQTRARTNFGHACPLISG